MSEIQTICNGLIEAATNPKTQLDRHLDAGKKIIGCMPYFCPEELVYAAGMVPFGLWGGEIQAPEARRFFPVFICSLLQTILELGIRGECDGLSAVMVPICCDSLKSMDANWRYAGIKVPVIPVAHAQNRKIKAGIEFTASQYRKIRDILSEIAGCEITDAEIAATTALYNARRDSVCRFLKAAATHPELICPSVRCAVLKAGYFMDVREHMHEVTRLTELLEQEPEKDWHGPKIVMSGIIADSRELLELLDSCGVAVVADQVTYESIRYMFPVPTNVDPIYGLAEQLGIIEGCPVLFDPGKTRGRLLVELVKKNKADGVIFTNTKFCDPEEYDYVPIKRMLDEAGIPNLMIEQDKQTSTGGRIRTALETFCDIIKR